MNKTIELQIIFVLAIIDVILSSIMIALSIMVGNNSGKIGMIVGLMIFILGLWAISIVENKKMI